MFILVCMFKYVFYSNFSFELKFFVLTQTSMLFNVMILN